MSLFNLYHQHSKNQGVKKNKLHDTNEWPTEWKTQYQKIYPRFGTFNLPEPTLIDLSLGKVIDERKSQRSFSALITENKLSQLLGNAVGKTADGRRKYPSAGRLFPLEFYLLILKDVGKLTTGVYHYSVDQHSLTKIFHTSLTKEFVSELTIEDYLNDATFAIAITATFSRSQIKYGERSYRFSLIETGIATQNLHLCATALGIGSLSIGGTYDSKVEDLLDIDGFNESLTHFIGFG